MRRRPMVALLAAVLTVALPAQEPPRNPAVNRSGATVAGPIGQKELELWIDQFLADYLKDPSASLGFVLVKDGKIFFQKGYGYADSRRKMPVLPDQTLFYAASVPQSL